MTLFILYLAFKAHWTPDIGAHFKLFCLFLGDDAEDLQALENGSNSARRSRKKSKTPAKTPAKTRKIAPSKYGCLCLSLLLYSKFLRTASLGVGV